MDDALMERIKLAREGLDRAKNYSRCKGLPLNMQREGVEQVRFYNKLIIDLMRELYSSKI